MEAPYQLSSLIDNDEKLYRYRLHADKQLALKKARGVFDQERAREAYTGLVELIAKEAEKALAEYEERSPRPWHVAWSRAERDALARELVEKFEEAWSQGGKSEEGKMLLASLPAKYRGGKLAEQLPDADVRARRRGGFTLAQLQGLATLGETNTDDLKLDTGRTRVWLSRMTREDGMPYDHQVTVEARSGKSPEWKTVVKYPAKGRPIAEFLLPEREVREADALARKMFPGRTIYVVADRHHPGQYLLRSEDLTRAQLLRAVKAADSLRAKAAKHEAGDNPRTASRRPHRFDQAALARIERAAGASRAGSGAGPGRKRAPFTAAQRAARGLPRIDASLKGRIQALVGKGAGKRRGSK